MIEERRDWATRPEDIWRCESCSWWEPRLDPRRAVNAQPTCPYCRVGRYWHAAHVPLSAAVRFKEVSLDGLQ